MIPIFKKIGIKAIIRLNESLYDVRVFEKHGIRVFDMEFPDGSCPDSSVISEFTKIVKHFE